MRAAPPEIDLQELAGKYGLSDGETQNVVEASITGTLSRVLKLDIEVSLNGKAEIVVYRNNGVNTFTLEQFDSRLRRQVRDDIALNMEVAVTMNRYEATKWAAQRVIEGEVARIMGDSLCVRACLEGYGVELFCECLWKDQTPKERYWYRQGQTLSFYVLSVRPVSEQACPRLEVRLSRNSQGLPEGLLRKELDAIGHGGRIHCVKRIAGAFSEIETENRLPREAIKKVSDELRERIEILRRG